jgi:hypothetical protein
MSAESADRSFVAEVSPPGAGTDREVGVDRLVWRPRRAAMSARVALLRPSGEAQSHMAIRWGVLAKRGECG